MTPLILPIALFIIYRIYLNSKKIREKEETLARRKQQDAFDENQRRKAKMAEEEKQQKEVEAYQEKLNVSYFIQEQWENDNKEPYTLEQIKDLLEKGDLTLNSNIKFGYNTTNFNKIQTFKEFTIKFSNFM